jgi:uncharacterized membrane protein YqiK
MGLIESLSLQAWLLVVFIVLLFGLPFLAYLLGMFRYIPNNRIGVLERLWSPAGSVKSGLIALNGEAGFQPQVMRGGFQILKPLQYRVHILPLVTIPQGQIGYVFARDGQPLSPTQALASNINTLDYQDAAAFLKAGGQKGPQRKILREGTYAINLAQFVIITRDRIYSLRLDPSEEQMFAQMARLIAERDGFSPIVIQGADDLIGIVTVHDGPSLSGDQIIAPTVGVEMSDDATYHNNFQDPEKFLAAGGRRGRQLQVLVEGTYYINRLFATVEMIKKTTVEVGNVGVVVSYTGDTGKDISGDDYKHGELVDKGRRGVWETPILPGKYAFNTYAGHVIMVPTTNFILKWTRAEVGAHKFDENLSEVSLITKDAFEPDLPLSVVVHIDYRKAPLVIQRFGDIKRLVEQTLDPMVSAYFKNIAQTRTLIELIQDRSAIQQQSAVEMKEKFAKYNLELLEVLIGTPNSAAKPGVAGGGQIEAILTQLRSRQIAEEQVETYQRQEKAAVKERQLREAEARAKQQTSLTESELSIIVQTNEGKAEYARAQQQASQIQTLAGAEAEKIRILGEGEAKKIQALATAEAERAARVGIAQAMAIQEQVKAYGGPKFQLTQQVMNRFAEAVQAAGIDIVPRVMIAGGGSNGTNGSGAMGGSNLIEGLLAMLLAEKMGEGFSGESAASSPEAEALRRQISSQIGAKKVE